MSTNIDYNRITVSETSANTSDNIRIIHSVNNGTTGSSRNSGDSNC